jgi:hypothetical protein
MSNTYETNNVTNIEWTESEIDAYQELCESVQEVVNSNYQAILFEAFDWDTNGSAIYEAALRRDDGSRGLLIPSAGFDRWGELENGDVVHIYGIVNYLTGHAGLWNRDVGSRNSYINHNDNCVLSSRQNGVNYEDWGNYSATEVDKYLSGYARWYRPNRAVLENKIISTSSGTLTTEEKLQRVVQTGEQYIGVRYLWMNESGSLDVINGKNKGFNKWDKSAIYCSQVAWLGWKEGAGMELDATPGLTFAVVAGYVYQQKAVAVYRYWWFFGWHYQYLGTTVVTVQIPVYAYYPTANCVFPSDFNWAGRSNPMTTTMAQW